MIRLGAGPIEHVGPGPEGPPGSSGIIANTQGNAAVDLSTGSASYSTLIQQTVRVGNAQGLVFFRINFGATVSSTAGNTIRFRLTVNGTVVGACACTPSTTGNSTVFMERSFFVPPLNGAVFADYIIAVEWARDTSGTARCRSVTQPTYESANLDVDTIARSF